MEPRCSSAFDLDDVVLGLFQADPFEPRGWKPALQAAPDCQRAIVGGGQTTLEPRHIAVEVAMVDVVDHQVLHNPVDLPQIDHHACIHVHGSADIGLDLVVVAMVPRTCPEHLAIASLVPLWLGEDVTGREGQSSGHVDTRQLTHVYLRKSILRRITSKLPPPLPPAGGATASMIFPGY